MLSAVTIKETVHWYQSHATIRYFTACIKQEFIIKIVEEMHKMKLPYLYIIVSIVRAKKVVIMNL